ncbi:MAG TPA: glycosyltransferase family 2 protein [Terriglobia bacterium]|nr:glycosyltransferase family 2 protein [Terriglobia bacterium]
MDSPALSIVVPLHNEEENVQALVEEIRQALGNFPGGLEMVFVDDGSTDSTLGRLHEAARSDPRIRLAHFRRNLGQTAAMAAGFHLARGRAVATLDGDLQNDPADVPGLVALLKDWDVVCGVRTKRRDTWLKRISSRIANGFRNWATGDNIVDTGCTLKAYRREWLDRFTLYNGMHRFLPTLLKMRGARVTQVPVGHRPRRAGKTHYGTWGRMVKGLEDVWAVRWMQRNCLDFDRALEMVTERPVPDVKSPQSGQGAGRPLSD